MSYDFFGVQPLLIDRIKTKVTGINSVISGMNQDELLILETSPPFIYVQFDSYSLLDQVEREAQITQSWLVVIAIENDRSLDIESRSGIILGKLLNVLLGWQPSKDYGALLLESAPKMTFQPAIAQPQPALTNARPGLWHIPLAFSTTLFVTGDIP